MARQAVQSSDAKRQAFYDKLAPQDLAPLWEVLKAIILPTPKSACVPHVWRNQAYKPLLMEAGGLLTAEEAERRVLVLENPALPGQSKITNSLYAGVQLILPGEIAPAHRHTSSALRFVLESDGGYTSVAGERTTMKRGDFIITPNMGWHDHGQEQKSPVMWVDGLDLHMVNFFDSGFMDHMNDKSQIISKPEGDSHARFGSGMAPMNSQSPFGITTPIFNYTYANSRPALMGFTAGSESDPHLAFTLRYTNPLTGDWALPTIATWLTHYPRGLETKPMRSTDGQVIIVVEGEITLSVDSKMMSLGESDIGVIPAWTTKQIRASKDAIVFTFSDRSAQEKLGFYREERLK
jgi:gentisate 1,2-dioxygenase